MKKIALMLLFAFAGAYAQTEPVKFSAKIQNRNSDSLVIRNQKINRVIKADAKGNFTDSFTGDAGFYQFFDGIEQASLYLKPGFDLTMNVDGKKFDETLAYKGKGEKENNFLAAMARDNEALGKKLEANPDQVTQFKLINELLDKLDATLKDTSLDEGFRTTFGQQIAGQRQQMAQMAAQAEKSSKMKGQASATFNYENAKGGTTKLEDLKGKYVYVDVWATWCGPCRQQIPFLKQVEEKYHGKKIEFVSISIDKASDHDKWKKMVTDQALGGTQLFADKDWSSAFVQSYGINSIPRFILIGPDGNIVDADAKRPSDPALQAQLDSLLK
ncbi:MAG: TlpA family protein disulfide reductase [Flavobacterium psychrophilum]|nr:MAG: TlpA family protein disulfide reductase [Flavobacterium psychrophilum]